MVENNQRKVSEKLDDVNRRQRELDDLLDIQRQTLHKISGMSADEARRQLLERLNQELAHEQGAVILRQEKELAAVVDAKAKEMLITSLQRFAASHTAEATTSTVEPTMNTARATVKPIAVSRTFHHGRPSWMS